MAEACAETLFRVKNTFMELQEEADDFELNSDLHYGRQISAPAAPFRRQVSSSFPFEAVQEGSMAAFAEQKRMFHDYLHGKGELQIPSLLETGMTPDMVQQALMVPEMTPEMMGGGAADLGVDEGPLWDATTVMMRNLPNRYTRELLIEEICASGFTDGFDFLYVPIDPETNANKGYAFINFLDNHISWRFKATFEGRQMSRFNSNKFVAVTPAALQGLEANYAHYSTARCNRGEPSMRPLFLRIPANTGPVATRHRRGGRNRRPTGKGAEKKEEEEVAAGGPPSSSPSSSAPSTALNFCPFCGGRTQAAHRFCQSCGSCLEGLS